jgi:NAD(P)H-nitrite reductase large subunit
MLETRVRVINARMVDIDRSDKNIILHDETIIPYDTLVLAMGLQDKTLQSMGYVSRGIAPVPKDKKRIEGLLSVDDPYLYQHLRNGGTLMNALTNRRRPQNCVVYGRALHGYATIKGLLSRGMRPEQITLVLPGKTCHLNEAYDDEIEMTNDLPFINPEAFEDD